METVPTMDSPAFDHRAYREFRYERVDVDDAHSTVRLAYSLRGDGEPITFEEIWRFPGEATDDVGRRAFHALGRLLLLAGGMSYYKVAAPPLVTLRGSWTDRQVEFVRLLIENGLAEFATTNNLPVPLRPDVQPDEAVRREHHAAVHPHIPRHPQRARLRREACAIHDVRR